MLDALLHRVGCLLDAALDVHRASVVGANILRHQIVLIGRRGDLLLPRHHCHLVAEAVGHDDLLPLSADGRSNHYGPILHPS